MKLILREAIDDFNLEDKSSEELELNAPLDIEVNEPIEEEIDTSGIFIDETDPKLVEFITSEELNELRDILIELPEDIHLLLLDDKAIVIARVDENNDTYLYCLEDDANELSLIKMPMRLEEILANDMIIQYTPANISDVHEKVVELFAKELQPDEEEIVPDKEIDDEEIIEDEPIEKEDDEYEQDEINS